MNRPPEQKVCLLRRIVEDPGEFAGAEAVRFTCLARIGLSVTVCHHSAFPEIAEDGRLHYVDSSEPPCQEKLLGDLAKEQVNPSYL